MAKAVANVKTVMTLNKVDLTLTPKEAQFLLCVLARIGGSPTHSARKYGQAINEALLDAGVEQALQSADRFEFQTDHSMGSAIYFKDYEKLDYKEED